MKVVLALLLTIQVSLAQKLVLKNEGDRALLGGLEIICGVTTLKDLAPILGEGRAVTVDRKKQIFFDEHGIAVIEGDGTVFIIDFYLSLKPVTGSKVTPTKSFLGEIHLHGISFTSTMTFAEANEALIEKKLSDPEARKLKGLNSIDLGKNKWIFEPEGTGVPFQPATQLGMVRLMKLRKK